MAGDTADRVEEFIPFGSRNGIGCLLFEDVCFIERDEEVGDLVRDQFLVLLAQGIGEARHRGAGFGLVWGGDEFSKIVRIHARPDSG